ncbi:E3 ubiquitin-protein ligase XIAP-like [Littorina saxatilis]|uniref:E3 ubiquitin-protein ligase XIAP-like n=1 Tax=Littorina saxatilis TaxID=31220 RepID=UPI0038B56F7B
MAFFNHERQYPSLLNDSASFRSSTTHQTYRFEFARLSTFAKLDLAVSPIRLAQSGFYYAEELDDITCFSCHVTKRQWTHEEGQVTAIHLSISPNCLHANSRDQTNVPIKHDILQVSFPDSTRQNDSDNADASFTEEETTDSQGQSSVSFFTSYFSPKHANGLPSTQSNGVEILGGSSLEMMQPISTKGKGERDISGGESAVTFADIELNGHVYPRSFDTLSNQPPTFQGFHSPIQPVQAPEAFPDSSSFLGHAASNGDQEQLQEDSEGDSLDMRRAACPSNASVRVRLSTFSDWPAAGLPSPRSLVIAGFYCMGTGDSVRCFYCGVTLRNWRENDDPWETHVRFRFSCDYVMTVKGEDFICQTQVKLATGHPVSSTPIECESHLQADISNVSNYRAPPRNSTAPATPHSDTTSRDNTSPKNRSAEGYTIPRTLNTGAQVGDGGTRVEVASTQNSVSASLPRPEDLQTDGEHTSSETHATTSHLFPEHQEATATQQTARQTHTSVSTEHSNNTTRVIGNQEEATYLQSLHDTNRRLRQRVTCRVCRNRSVDTIFLPCGHLCTCEACAASVRECCLCHDRIRGTAHVYME